MNNWTLIYLLVFLSGTASTLLLTPLFGAIAARTGFMDVPAANHKKHLHATPLLGGAAMFTGWISCISCGYFAIRLGWAPGFYDSVLPHLPGFLSAMHELLAIAGGAALAVLLGLVDDRRALSAAGKFGGQFVIAAIAATWGGVQVNIFVSNPAIVWGATVFWIMLMMNSINFFDNMDGLAAGTIAIAMGFFAVIAALNAQYFIAVLSALSCGVVCGFWYYNTAPAAIFMGDSGSHFLGYVTAVTAAGVSFFDKGFSLSRFPVLIPLLILALPLFDTAMVVLIRTMNLKPFWIGDHNHISHRFVRMGLSRRQAVLLVHLMALSIGLGTLPVYWGDFRTAAVLICQSLLLLVIITILQFSLSARPDADGKKS